MPRSPAPCCLVGNSLYLLEFSLFLVFKACGISECTPIREAALVSTPWVSSAMSGMPILSACKVPIRCHTCSWNTLVASPQSSRVQLKASPPEGTGSDDSLPSILSPVWGFSPQYFPPAMLGVILSKSFYKIQEEKCLVDNCSFGLSNIDS